MQATAVQFLSDLEALCRRYRERLEGTPPTTSPEGQQFTLLSWLESEGEAHKEDWFRKAESLSWLNSVNDYQALYEAAMA